MTEPQRGPRIAVLGDSMAQGLTNGAVTRPEWSYPAIIARACNLSVGAECPGGPRPDFVVPSFGPPGLPINIEAVLREAEAWLGPSLKTRGELARFLVFVIAYLDRIERRYERLGPPGNESVGVPDHLGIAGVSVRECLELTASECDELITEDPGSLAHDFASTASLPLYRIARQVLNPSGLRERQTWSPVRCLQEVVRKRETKVLIVHVGNADTLGAVAQLELKRMPSGFRGDRRARAQYNVTDPGVFARDFEDLTDAIEKISAPKGIEVFVGTLPRVTVAPFIRGLGRRDTDGYYDVYSRFFVQRRLRGLAAPRTLSREEARELDRTVDQYNAAIVAVTKRRGWNPVDVCSMVSRLAIADNQNPEAPLRDYVRGLSKTRGGDPIDELLTVDPVPDVRAYGLNAAGNRTEGGLFGLDGGHPSTVGYGLVADLFLQAMREKNVVPPEARIDWKNLIAEDTCLRTGPLLWREVMAGAERYPRLVDFLFRR